MSAAPARSGIARLYDRYVMPRLVDAACAHRRITRQREKVVPQAEGVVVELGIGAGHNLALYDPARVRRVIGVDPNPGFRRLGQPRLAGSRLDVELVEAGAEAMDLPAGLADTVVVTYTMCSIGDPVAALASARRVLKETGRLLFVEHASDPEPSVAWWQRRITPLTRALAGGCRLDRDPLSLLVKAGFAIEHVESGRVAGLPRFVAYHHAGSARPA